MYLQPSGKPDGQQVLACEGSPPKDRMLIGRARTVVGLWEQVVAETRVALNRTVEYPTENRVPIHLHLDHLLS